MRSGARHLLRRDKDQGTDAVLCGRTYREVAAWWDSSDSHCCPVPDGMAALPDMAAGR